MTYVNGPFSAPGHQTVLGEEREGQAVTQIVLMDNSKIMVHWDGRHEVANMQGGSAHSITIYMPPGTAMRKKMRRLHIPWARVAYIDHIEREDD